MCWTPHHINVSLNMMLNESSSTNLADKTTMIETVV